MRVIGVAFVRVSNNGSYGAFGCLGGACAAYLMGALLYISEYSKTYQNVKGFLSGKAGRLRAAISGRRRGRSAPAFAGGIGWRGREGRASCRLRPHLKG